MALSEIEKLERRYAENPQGLTFAPLAEVHRKNGDVSRALELLRSGLTLHPGYVPASIVLGRCHLDLGELPAAETAFTHVLGLDGENVIALKALADIAERQYRFDEAERLLRTLLSVDRSNDDARDQLGRVEASRRQAETASSASPDAAPTTVNEEPAPSSGAEGAPRATGAVTEEADAASVASEAPAPGLPPLPEPPREAMLAWAEDSGSDAADEATPLQLEDLDLSGADATSPPEGIEVEQAVTLDEPVEPLSGLVGRDGESGEADFHDLGAGFRVETAEDIVLRSSGGSEFQMANASEELLSARPPNDPDPLMPETPAIEAEGAGGPPATPAQATPSASALHDSTGDSAPDEFADEFAPAAAWDEEPAGAGHAPPGEPEPAASSAAAAGAAPSESAPGEMHEPVGPAAEEQPAAAETTSQAAAERQRPAAPEAWATPLAEPPTHPEPDLVVTESMAELLLQQGHPAEALVVYRHLVRRTGDRRFQDRVAELERTSAPPPATAAAPSAEAVQPPPAAAPAPSYSVRQTGGRSVRELLSGVLAGRLAAASAPVPRQAEASRGAADAAPEGAPTRPAHDSLSLSSVFGEESTPTQPAVPAANAAAAPQGGVSYDEFFGGSTPSGSSRPRAADAKSDDLDQFHAWLQNLKR